ncbi:hypothetical protein QAD02_022345 [Eretmocerus hayati]|uniref:Uncharacterized protein n=1 Tax=Eretmocerus hayati TaxID=131215 RepID=A0ACC2PUD7_9HYME|nr:hypothetical protein QAD02_022345 [Eretmocerus hayati]
MIADDNENNYVDSDDEEFIPQEVMDEAQEIALDLLPDKSRDNYLQRYLMFIEWRKSRNIRKSFQEPVLLTYFRHLRTFNRYSSSTLWTIYSMLNACIKAFDHVDISKYLQLKAYIKKLHKGHVPKKSKVLSAIEVNNFCEQAPEPSNLLAKVVLALGLSGCCRKHELVDLLMEQVLVLDDCLVVTIPKSKSKTNVEKIFRVVGNFYEIVKRYLLVRQKIPHPRFFLSLRKTKFINLPAGKNTIGAIPARIAAFLGLPNPKEYTSHCIRRTAATIYASTGVTTNDLMHFGRWKDLKTAQSYRVDTDFMRDKVATSITDAIMPAFSVCLPHTAHQKPTIVNVQTLEPTDKLYLHRVSSNQQKNVSPASATCTSFVQESEPVHTLCSSNQQYNVSPSTGSSMNNVSPSTASSTSFVQQSQPAQRPSITSNDHSSLCGHVPSTTSTTIAAVAQCAVFTKPAPFVPKKSSSNIHHAVLTHSEPLSSPATTINTPSVLPPSVDLPKPTTFVPKTPSAIIRPRLAPTPISSEIVPSVPAQVSTSSAELSVQEETLSDEADYFDLEDFSEEFSHDMDCSDAAFVTSTQKDDSTIDSHQSDQQNLATFQYDFVDLLDETIDDDDDDGSSTHNIDKQATAHDGSVFKSLSEVFSVTPKGDSQRTQQKHAQSSKVGQSRPSHVVHVDTSTSTVSYKQMGNDDIGRVSTSPSLDRSVEVEEEAPQAESGVFRFRRATLKLINCSNIHVYINGECPIEG